MGATPARTRARSRAGMRITELLANGPAQLEATRQGRIIIRVPMLVKRHSVYKRIIGAQLPAIKPPAPLKLTPFQLALVRAHRWLAMLENGEVGSMKEL